MKMMIIDDNRQIREGIKNGIDWENYGIDEIKLAENGKEGMETFIQFLPDIVLLDVMMPQMTGLEFLKQAKKIKEDVKVLIISGYSEFEYAVEAMKYGAVGYELKPIKMQQLLLTILNLIEGVQQNAEKSKMQQLHWQVYQEKRLMDILHGHERDKGKIKEFICKRYGIDKRSNVILMCAMVDEIEDSSDEEKLILLEQLLKDVLYDRVGTGLLCREKSRYYIYQTCTASLIEQINRQNELSAILCQWNDLISSNGISLSGGISRAYPVSELAQCCEEAEYTAKMNQMAGVGTCSIFSEVITDSRLEKLYREQIHHIDMLFDVEDDAEYIMEKIDEIFRLFADYHIYEKTSCMRITLLLMERIRQYFINQEYILKEVPDQSSFRQVDKLQSISECSRLCRQFYSNLYQQYQEQYGGNFSIVVQNARNYINQYYAELITVETAAEYVERTPNYLSHIFKKECGVSFSEYLNSVRIKKAKELIQNTNLMIHEIAEKVGYVNYVHFAQVFKKQEGISPVQMRKRR